MMRNVHEDHRRHLERSVTKPKSRLYFVKTGFNIGKGRRRKHRMIFSSEESGARGLLGPRANWYNDMHSHTS